MIAMSKLQPNESSPSDSETAHHSSKVELVTLRWRSTCGLGAERNHKSNAWSFGSQPT